MEKRFIFLVVALLSVILTGCIEKPTEKPIIPDNKPAEELIVKEIEEPKEVNIPISIENNCVGFYPPFPEEAEAIPLMGGGWVRPHPGPFMWGWIEESKGKFNFEMIDRWAMQSAKSNIAILATIFPFAEWDQTKCHSKECEVSEKDVFYPRGKFGLKNGIPVSRCATCNFDDYKNFLLKLVERYDGDGIDDMPGLKMPIKYYEILNEPDLNADFLKFFKGKHEDYVKILKESYNTIKSTCPDCKVVQGGAAGIDPKMNDYWEKVFELGGGNYFDIANIHYVNYGDTDTLNVKDFKKLLLENGINKPIWVTESEFKPEDDVLKSVKGAFDSGAEKIFFSALIVGKKDKPEMNKFLGVYEKALEMCRKN